MKRLVLRFDIDTYRCIAEGAPNLLQLAREEGVKFSFFCNMGRSTSQIALLSKLLSPRTHTHHTATTKPKKLSPANKLGMHHFILTILLNPRVGASQPKVLQQALAEGHDVGLHGGSNHGAWQHSFKNWTEARIRREVTAGKALFERATGQVPTLFSSPGWQGSNRLNRVLQEMGFTGSADRHGPTENQVETEEGIYSYPTNVIFEPGGVAYFESLAAQGADTDEIERRFRNTIADERELYVLYDHPCFAGIGALQSVRRVVRLAMGQDVEITTLSALSKSAPTH